MKKENSKRKSICFLSHDIITGGIENVLIEAIKILHTEYEIEVVSLFGGVENSVSDKLPPEVKVRNFAFAVNNIKDKIIRHFCSRLYLSRFYFNKVIGRKFDYVISLKSFERFACFSNKGTHNIYWCHNDWHTKFISSKLSKPLKKDKKLIKALYKNHDMVWAVNEVIADELKELFNLDNIFALPNPVNCKEILQKAEEPCDTVFDKAKTNIVLLGRISSEKGFLRVIRIMAQNIFSKFPNAHVYIIGGGEHINSFSKRIDELGLNNKVTLLGNKSNPYPYLKQADLLLSPSKYESFGLAMMEAMLLNVPVIATATTGAKYVTQNGKYACCVENKNELLERAIYRFLDNPNSYNYEKEEAKGWVLQHDVSKFGERLLELLEKCEKSKK